MGLLRLGPAYYRTNFLLSAVETLSPPFFLVYVLLTSILRRPAFDAIAVITYAASPLVWIPLASQLSISRNDRRARQLGATPIPRAKGKWPGNIDIMLRFASELRHGYVMQAMTDVLDEHGCNTLNIRILWKDIIISRDELHLHAVHSTNFDLFERGFEAAEKTGTFLGRGIFALDGNAWKKERTLLRPFLSKERISDFEIFAKYADKVLAILSEVADSGRPIDIQDLFGRFTLDAAFEFLLGSCPNSLDASRPVPFHAHHGSKGSATDDQYGTFLHAFEEVQVAIAMRWRLGAFFPLYELFGDRTMPHVKVITSWVKPTVEKALQGKAQAKQRGVQLKKEERTLLDSLVENTDDEETVRYGLINVLMASRDTTASLLSLTVYLLAMHPEVMRRLRTEVLEVCGRDSYPTHQTFRKMTYMTAVLNETLRLFPPAPLGIRNAVKDVLLPMPEGQPPLFFPNRARFSWLLLPLQRRRDLWGADADAFDPDRWLDPNRTANYRERPWIFIPFLSGPRNCPGQEFALSEASFLLVRLLQRFSSFDLALDAFPKGSLPPPEWKHGKGRQSVEKCWPSTAFTVFIKGGLWVRPRN